MVTDAAIINLLGTAEVAKHCDRSVSAVQNWKVRGIPWRWRAKVGQFAKRQGISVPVGFVQKEGM